MDTHNIIQLALQHHEEGNLHEAERLYREILKVQPYNCDALNLIGVLFSQGGQYDDSINYIKKSLEYNPNNAGAYNNLGTSYQGKYQMKEAIFCYKKAIEIDPHFINAYYNLGAAYQDMGQLDEAIAWYQKVLLLEPHLVNAYYNLGIALRDRGSIDEAINCYQKALQYDPDNAYAHFNMSLVYLLSGKFKEGWKEFDWRWKIENFRQRSFIQPQWDGSDIADKRILLYAEDGFGDTIQFIRYIPYFKDLRAKILIECQSELFSLINNLQGHDRVIAQGEQLPEFDLHCSLLRLPAIFDTTIENIPSSEPYISVKPALVKKWKDKMQSDGSRVKIGLVWAGSPREGKLLNRSCSFELFLPLFQLDNAEFYSLQKGQAAQQAKIPPEDIKLIDLTENLTNFSDTAALIENLDLVISVDTAVAHLAGAIGKPVWTLVSFPPDWRWLLNREDSPWYPTMRLFRQQQSKFWEPVMARLSEELKIFIESYGSG